MSLSINLNARPLAAPPSMTASTGNHTAPNIMIPSSTVSSPVEPSLVTPSPPAEQPASDKTSVPVAKSLKICGTKEKVGRWSEHEHSVFLEGLKLYGKQWKTIAGMIGTRSVVQVRTHAQKYFQKLERKNQGMNLPKSKPERQSKRKSLPNNIATRKKAKKPAAVGSTARVSSASSLGPAVTLDGVSPTVPEMPSFPSYVSNSSFSTSSDSWSAVSPTSVMADVIDIHNPVDKAALAVEIPSDEAFEMIGDDPLEWLIETGTHHQFLPESSLPIFPDLMDDKVVNMAASESESMVEDAINNMVDPSVTMQSLILPAEQ